MPQKLCKICQNEIWGNGQFYCADCRQIAIKRQVRAMESATKARDNGKLKFKTACEHCGTKGKLQMHHPDYSKPRLVLFLCVPCHKDKHRTGWRDS